MGVGEADRVVEPSVPEIEVEHHEAKHERTDTKLFFTALKANQRQ